jgi:adenine-specific DNA-methyltransferase
MTIDFSQNTVVNADCLQVLPTMPAESVQFILTDPPYITNYQSRDGRSVPNDNNSFWLRPAFAHMFRVLEPDRYCVSFYGWSRADQFVTACRAAGFRIIGHLTFPKRYSSSVKFLRYQHESAYLLAKGSPKMPNEPISDVIDWRYSGNRFHPTEKPLSVLMPLIHTFSEPEDVVLDPFSGSGSSLLAARRLGRRYFGIELDAGYHRIASKRLAENASAGRVAD